MTINLHVTGLFDAVLNYIPTHTGHFLTSQTPTTPLSIHVKVTLSCCVISVSIVFKSYCKPQMSGLKYTSKAIRLISGSSPRLQKYKACSFSA